MHVAHEVTDRGGRARDPHRGGRVHGPSRATHERRRGASYCFAAIANVRTRRCPRLRRARRARPVVHRRRCRGHGADPRASPGAARAAARRRRRGLLRRGEPAAVARHPGHRAPRAPRAAPHRRTRRRDPRAARLPAARGPAVSRLAGRRRLADRRGASSPTSSRPCSRRRRWPPRSRSGCASSTRIATERSPRPATAARRSRASPGRRSLCWTTTRTKLKAEPRIARRSWSGGALSLRTPWPRRAGATSPRPAAHAGRRWRALRLPPRAHPGPGPALPWDRCFLASCAACLSFSRAARRSSAPSDPPAPTRR